LDDFEGQQTAVRPILEYSQAVCMGSILTASDTV